MSQVTREARELYDEVMYDVPTRVHIAGTNRYVSVRGIKPYTLERLTRLWVERDADTAPDDSASTLKSMCKSPYFTIKEAVLMTLNSYWKIRLLYPLKWRIWAYFRGYTEGQVSGIIQEGKKKLPLTEHWINMAFSVDMRTDWMKMTKKEAEQHRAELLSEVNALSSRSSRSTASGDGESAPTGIDVG